MERAESRGRLEQLVSSKDEFIASISHEVRTPLTVAMGISHELQDRWAEIDPVERDELLRLVVDQTQDMSDLVEDLLVAARADIGKLPIHVEPMAVGPAIEAALAQRNMLPRSGASRPASIPAQRSFGGSNCAILRRSKGSLPALVF